MFKKATLAIAAVLIVGGLLFGGRLIPYAKTAFNQVRETARDSVPIDFQIEAARTQLDAIGPEINKMVQQIAREKADIKRLATGLNRQDVLLNDRKEQMMTLREHVASGEEVYVATTGTAYTTDRVREDLRHRFTIYQTAEKTREKSAQILDLRNDALKNAFTKLDDAQAQQRELEVQIENLVARQRMVEVASSANEFDIDNSQIAKTREMINDIASNIDAKEAYLELAPKYFGQIPVGEGQVSVDKDILEEMDAYFNSKVDDSVMVKSSK